MFLPCDNVVLLYQDGTAWTLTSMIFGTFFVLPSICCYGTQTFYPWLKLVIPTWQAGIVDWSSINFDLSQPRCLHRLSTIPSGHRQLSVSQDVAVYISCSVLASVTRCAFRRHLAFSAGTDAWLSLALTTFISLLSILPQPLKICWMLGLS